MVSTKQLEANRKNAQKSTGPRTEEGKEKSKLNALIHGLRADSLDVLPNEDPEAYRARVDAWIADFQPRDVVEEQLVRHAADVSWRLERAKKFETLTLSLRVADAMTEAERTQRHLLEEAWRKLLPFGPDVERFGLARETVTSILKQVQATAEGCVLLLQTWRNLREIVAASVPWTPEQELHVIRLLGQGPDTIGAAGVLDVVVANRTVLYPNHILTPDNWFDGTLRTFFDRTAARQACERRPKSAAQAYELLVTAADAAIARLEALLADRRRDGAVASRAVDQAGMLASFDSGNDAERLRRYQLSLHRELLRTVDTVGKRRRDETKLKKAESARADACTLASEARWQPTRPESASTTEAENQEPEPSDPPDPDAPNEPIVQVLFTTDDLRAADPAETGAPIESDRAVRKRREELKRRFLQARRAKPNR